MIQQTMNFATVVFDLGTFLYMMTSLKFRQSHKVDLLSLYHLKLSEYLDLEGEDKNMTLDALIKEFDDHRLLFSILAFIVRNDKELRACKPLNLCRWRSKAKAKGISALLQLFFGKVWSLHFLYNHQKNFF